MLEGIRDGRHQEEARWQIKARWPAIGLQNPTDKARKRWSRPVLTGRRSSSTSEPRDTDITIVPLHARVLRLDISAARPPTS